MIPRKKYNIDFIIDCKLKGWSGERIARAMKHAITASRINGVWRNYRKKHGLDTKRQSVAY